MISKGKFTVSRHLGCYVMYFFELKHLFQAGKEDLFQFLIHINPAWIYMYLYEALDFYSYWEEKRNLRHHFGHLSTTSSSLM